MDYFNDVFPIVLGLECVNCIAPNGETESPQNFIKNIFICVPKMNEGEPKWERECAVIGCCENLADL